MKRLGPNSVWSRLAEAQHEIMDGWLFEERLSYREVLARAKTEFGLTASLQSLSRYYHRRLAEREVEDLIGTQDLVGVFDRPNFDPHELRRTVFTVVAKLALRAATERPHELDALASLVKMLIDVEQNDLRRRGVEIKEKQWAREDSRLTGRGLPYALTKLNEMFGSLKTTLATKPKEANTAANPTAPSPEVKPKTDHGTRPI